MSLGTEPRTTARPAVPAATRARRSGWRDPRLWVGVLIVAVSVVAGSRLLAAADDTVTVWSVSVDAGPGALLAPGDLEPTRVRFADEGDLTGYFQVDDELPGELVLVRGVGAGELLPRAALGTAETAADSVELPVAVDAEQVPSAVRTGSVVSVHLIGARQAGPLLEEVTVVDAPPLESTFGTTTGRRQLVLGVSADDAAAFLDALGSVEQPVLTVVRTG